MGRERRVVDLFCLWFDGGRKLILPRDGVGIVSEDDLVEILLCGRPTGKLAQAPEKRSLLLRLFLYELLEQEM